MLHQLPTTKGAPNLIPNRVPGDTVYFLVCRVDDRRRCQSLGKGTTTKQAPAINTEREISIHSYPSPLMEMLTVLPYKHFLRDQAQAVVNEFQAFYLLKQINQPL